MADIGLDTILATILGANKDAVENSPYKPFSDATDLIGASILKASPQADIAESVIAGLLTGIVGGTTDRLTKDYANEQTQLLGDYLFAPGDSPKPEKLAQNIFEKGKAVKNVFQIGQAQDNAQAVFGALARADSPQAQQKILETAQKLNILPEDFDVGADSLTETSAPIAAPARPGLFPGETLLDKRQRYLTELMQQGVPGGAAQREVEQRLKNEKIGNEQALKQIQEIRDKVRAQRSILSSANVGVSGAGETGGALHTPRELLSSLYAIVSPEERQQRASQATLDSIRPEVVKANRSPGAVSDFDAQLLIGAGPSSDKTPQQNKEIIENATFLSELEQDYANFLEYYLAEQGTVLPTEESPGAQVLWRKYLEDHPVVATDPKTGKVTRNSNRLSWQEWAKQKAGVFQNSALQGGSASGQISREQALEELRRRGVVP